MSMTLQKLIECYRTDPDSNFPGLQYQVRIKHGRSLDRLSREHGSSQLQYMRLRTVMAWYEVLSDGGKIAMARSLLDRLRELFRFGANILGDRECARLFEGLSEVRLANPPKRSVQLTLDRVKAIRKTAHEHFGWGTIAFAQALQFELLLGQKDVIGEWVPTAEPGETNLVVGEKKWLRGLRWSDIDDDNMILRHKVGSGQRPIEVDLRTAPMVLEEIERSVSRSTSGPVILCEITGLPWLTAEFRRKWRLVAKRAGVPDDVTNRDSIPAGMIRGGPDRAKISQTYTLKRIDYSLRMSRRHKVE
jgi:hypothetical protein